MSFFSTSIFSRNFLSFLYDFADNLRSLSSIVVHNSLFFRKSTTGVRQTVAEVCRFCNLSVKKLQLYRQVSLFLPAKIRRIIKREEEKKKKLAKRPKKRHKTEIAPYNLHE